VVPLSLSSTMSIFVASKNLVYVIVHSHLTRPRSWRDENLGLISFSVVFLFLSHLFLLSFSCQALPSLLKNDDGYPYQRWKKPAIP
jgi:hypothetical protein